MYTKMYSLLFVTLTLFSFVAHSETVIPVPLVQENPKSLTNESTFINGPIYIVSNNRIETASYPNLEFVNGPIYIVNNSNLTAVSFPKLRYVNGPIYVTYNKNLGPVTYPEIKFVNGPIYFYGNKNQ
jgi:hypothetical protein